MISSNNKDEIKLVSRKNSKVFKSKQQKNKEQKNTLYWK